MKSWRIGEIAGIGIFVHWSFLILPLMIAGSALSAGSGLAVAVWSVVFVLAIFGCVLLHEVGHALMARQFGIGTHRITLLPIGGLASLDRMPRNPWQEFAVAVAGPLVNVAIAAVLFTLIVATGMVNSFVSTAALSSSFMLQLLWANVGLVIFNMLPAFPMDGGRVLRSLLGAFLSHSRATSIAAGVGQVMAVLFAMLGIYSQHWMLVFIAVFIYFAGRAEAQAVQSQAAMEGWRVADAMRTQFHLVPADITLEQAAQSLLFESQEDYPVVDNNRLVGMLDRNQALQQLAQGQGGVPIRDVMRQNVPTLDQHSPLSESITRMQTGNYSSMPVASGGRLVGVLSVASLRNLMTRWTARTPALDR